jgi:hypothetical protein
MVKHKHNADFFIFASLGEFLLDSEILSAEWHGTLKCLAILSIQQSGEYGSLGRAEGRGPDGLQTGTCRSTERRAVYSVNLSCQHKSTEV